MSRSDGKGNNANESRPGLSAVGMYLLLRHIIPQMQTQAANSNQDGWAAETQHGTAQTQSHQRPQPVRRCAPGVPPRAKNVRLWLASERPIMSRPRPSLFTTTRHTSKTGPGERTGSILDARAARSVDLWALPRRPHWETTARLNGCRGFLVLADMCCLLPAAAAQGHALPRLMPSLQPARLGWPH